jgi:hypothetical protein
LPFTSHHSRRSGLSHPKVRKLKPELGIFRPLSASVLTGRSSILAAEWPSETFAANGSMTTSWRLTASVAIGTTAISGARGDRGDAPVRDAAVFLAMILATGTSRLVTCRADPSPCKLTSVTAVCVTVALRRYGVTVLRVTSAPREREDMADMKQGANQEGRRPYKRRLPIRLDFLVAVGRACFVNTTPQPDRPIWQPSYWEMLIMSAITSA